MRALPPLLCTVWMCVCVCWSSTVWPDMHLNRSRGWGGPGVRNAKSYFPKPTRPHPAHARTGTHTHIHTHTAIPCRRIWPQSQTDFLSSVWTHICFLTTIIATDQAGRGPAYRCLLFGSHVETTWWWPRSVTSKDYSFYKAKMPWPHTYSCMLQHRCVTRCFSFVI